MSHAFPSTLDLIPALLRQGATIWGMKCVDYDYAFEKHLARSLKKVKSSSLGLTKKRKAVTRDNHNTGSDGEDEVKAESSELDDLPSKPSKHQRYAKGNAKTVRFKTHSEGRD